MSYRARLHAWEIEDMWSVKLSWSSFMNLRFLENFVGTLSKDPKLMLILCCMVGVERTGNDKKSHVSG